jgi:hypothetical protein
LQDKAWGFQKFETFSNPHAFVKNSCLEPQQMPIPFKNQPNWHAIFGALFLTYTIWDRTNLIKNNQVPPKSQQTTRRKKAAVIPAAHQMVAVKKRPEAARTQTTRESQKALN